MLANLTADYLAAQRIFREAQSPADRTAAPHVTPAALPKDKPTEELGADLAPRGFSREGRAGGPPPAAPRVAPAARPKENPTQALGAGRRPCVPDALKELCEPLSAATREGTQAFRRLCPGAPGEVRLH